jgi:hypothetical protein
MKELLETRLRYICRIIEENTQNAEKEEVKRLLKVI